MKELALGDSLTLKKNHPCGGNKFVIIRLGADIKLTCEKCGHTIMLPRDKLKKIIK